MASKHSKATVVKVNAVDLSVYTTESEINRGTKTHDNTTYGKDAEVYGPGLNTATYTMGGIYDTTASTGPRAALLAVYALNASVTCLRQIEGTGSLKPQDSFSAILTSYVETSPVNDYVKWKADFQVTGDITTTAQA